MDNIEDLEFSIEYNDHGFPVFVIGDMEYPILVLDYETVQKLLGAITDYLILSDDYYNED